MLPHHPKPTPHLDPAEELLRHDLGGAARPTIRQLGQPDPLVRIIDADAERCEAPDRLVNVNRVRPCQFETGEKDLTLREFASRAGMHACHLSKIEQGRMAPPQDPEILDRMMSYCGKRRSNSSTLRA